MQPGVVPGAVYEFHAAKAALGTGPGINSPLTTQAFDTSLNGNHGTLTNFGVQTPWAGTGTAADPYRLVLDGGNDYVNVLDAASLRPGLGDYTAEIWVYAPWTVSSSFSGLLFKGMTTLAPIGTWGILTFGTSTSILTCQDASVGGAYNLNAQFPALSAGLHHIVLCRVSGVYSRYADGALYSVRITPPAIANLSSPSSFRLGMQADGRYIGTSTPAARLYIGTGLSDAQVAQNYAAGPLWAPAVSGLPVIGSPIVHGMRV